MERRPSLPAIAAGVLEVSASLDGEPTLGGLARLWVLPPKVEASRAVGWTKGGGTGSGSGLAGTSAVAVELGSGLVGGLPGGEFL